MTKFSNSVFLISGTAIGSGLISLPIAAAKVGMFWITIIIAITFFVAYKTSSMTIELMKEKGRPLTIVELSYEISGVRARFISMLSLYILSVSLLSVYFAGVNSILNQFLGINSTILCIGLFSSFFILKSKAFGKINTLMVSILFGLIFYVIFSSMPKTFANTFSNKFDFSATMLFFPIIFTSFGVQNVCPFVAKQIGLENLKSIKRAFLIGTLIPAIIYIFWIYVILGRVYESDINLYNQIISEGVDVGVLIASLCDSAKFAFETLLLKLLTMFAILTSAAGIGIGLISSLSEVLAMKYRILTPFLISIIPAALAIFIPNAFMNILSFGGMIATVFVIFMPFYLTFKIQPVRGTYGEIICFIFGLIVVFVELFM